MPGLLTLPHHSRLATALVLGGPLTIQRITAPNIPYRKPVAPTPVFTPPPASRVIQTRTVTMAAFDHPKNYLEFLEREPRYIRNFLINRKCPLELFEDFEQSMHLHLMTPPGAKSVNYGKSDKLATYHPSRMGGIGTRWAWAKYLNTMLSNEYGKLINRNKKGGIRGEHVVTISDCPLEENGALDHSDRERLMDFSGQTLLARVAASEAMAYIRYEGGEMVYRMAKALMVYDNLTEAARVMGISTGKANRLRTTMQEIMETYRKNS
jgi:hypothetical protein